MTRQSVLQEVEKQKPKRDNLDEKEQLRKHEKKEKKALCDNLDEEQKEHLKIEDNKRKKEKHSNFGS